MKWWGVTSGQREEFPLDLSLSSPVEPEVVPVYTGTVMAPNDEGTHYATAFLLDPHSGLHIQSADVDVQISAPPERIPIKGSTEEMAPRRLAEFEQQACADSELPKQTLAILEGHIKNVRVAFDTGDWTEVDRRLDFVKSYWGRWTSQREQRVSELKQLTGLRSQAKALKKAPHSRKGSTASGTTWSSKPTHSSQRQTSSVASKTSPPGWSSPAGLKAARPGHLGWLTKQLRRLSSQRSAKSAL